MRADQSVDPSQCWLHGPGARVQRFSEPAPPPGTSNARLSWWVCPQCEAAAVASSPVPPASAPAATPEAETRKIADPREALFHIEQEAFAALGGGTMSVNAPARRQTVQSLASVLRAIRAVALPHSEAFLTPAATTGGEAEPLSVDRLLFRLEEEMHCHLDQPLRGDFMSLTRGWRDILTPLTAQSSELAALRARVTEYLRSLTLMGSDVQAPPQFWEAATALRAALTETPHAE